MVSLFKKSGLFTKYRHIIRRKNDTKSGIISTICITYLAYGTGVGFLELVGAFYYHKHPTTLMGLIFWPHTLYRHNIKYQEYKNLH